MKTFESISPEVERDIRVDTARWLGNKTKPSTLSRVKATRRRRRVPHLVLGLLLVVACTATFLVISMNAGERRPVLALARAVTVGHVLNAQDLRLVNVAVDPGVSYVDADQAAFVVGKTMSVSLPAGAMLPADAVGAPVVPDTGQAIASLSLKSGQVPQEVSPGARVSVVFVPGATGGTGANPPATDGAAAWPAVVTNVAPSTTDQNTVVSVQLTEAAARQVAAIPSSQLSLVLLSGGGR